jgi:serine/threonine-protein kinase
MPTASGPVTPFETLRVASQTVTALAGGNDRQVIARAMRIGLWTWPSFVLLDAYMCFVVFPGTAFTPFVLYRIAVQLLLLAIDRASHRPHISVSKLFAWLRFGFAAASFTIALMAIPLGGITSSYMHGISIVALVWAAVVPTSWRRGLPAFLVIGLAFPIVMGITAAVSPQAREAWLTRGALIVFASHYVFVLSTCTLGLILSHLVWSAQQRARNVGSYRLEQLLGKGGMGEVWQGRHHLLARRAAIKLIRPAAIGTSGEGQATLLARFEREAQATALLRSPHTISLYDFGVSDTGAFFYVMELLQGCDLERLVARFGPQTAERVIHVIEQVCESLGEAHAAGLVHRDIKPSNIYLCRMGLEFDFVKVLDFGIAKMQHAGERPDPQLTMHHTTGTPGYMAPETLLGEPDVDRRADIYALGCVAYRLLTGHLVFEAETAMKVLIKHIHDVPLPPSQHTELPVPRELDELILRCLEKDPALRPQDAREVAVLARRCRVQQRWDPDRARAWWESHLPELCDTTFTSTVPVTPGALASPPTSPA